MTAVKILVVRNDSMTLEQFGELEVDVHGAALENIEFVHAEVSAGEVPEIVHNRVKRMVEEHSPVLIFVVEDEREVSDWLVDMELGDFINLEVPMNTSEGLVIGYYGVAMFDDDICDD